MLTLSSGVTIPPAGSASQVAIRRLQKDFAKLMQDPVDGIKALPNEDNILEWHYCLRGSPDTPFEGGYYWGKVIFKENFPWSPPAITMITPNGRFSTNTRLCLSISDYHPESWNPGWTVSAILIGLHSFMNENQPAAGAIPGTPQEQKNFAAASKEFNCKYREFRRFFPQFVQEWTGVVPHPDEPNVAPVMLPEHATPSGIPVPSIQHHSSRGAYAAAHHNLDNMAPFGQQMEEMMRAVRGAVGALPPMPGAAAGGVAGVAGAVAGAAAGAAAPAQGFHEQLLQRFNEMAGGLAGGLRQRPYAAGGAADLARRRAERLARFGYDQINGGPVRGVAAGANNEQANGNGGADVQPQNPAVAADVIVVEDNTEDGPGAPKRPRLGDDEDNAITLD